MQFNPLRPDGAYMPQSTGSWCVHRKAYIFRSTKFILKCCMKDGSQFVPPDGNLELWSWQDNY